MAKRKRGKEKMKTVSVVSLGCSKNLVDTEVMLGALAAAGYVPGVEPEGADVVLVNTCAFIREAVEESLEVLEELSALRREGDCGKLVVAGCLPQREKERLGEKFPEIDLLIGTSSYPDIVSLLEGAAGSVFSPCDFLHDHTYPRLLVTAPWTAYLKIAEGCSNRCSYCLIPSLRGAYRSREPESLAAEAEGLVEIGVRELVLVAQDTTRYGRDPGGGSMLPGLLHRISRIDGIKWIRVMYAYPELVDTGLASAIAEIPEVCNYLDMPVQHIDPQILGAMNRRGGPDAIYRAIETLRSTVPGLCLRTTVLTGFPGETERQFDRLLDFIGKTRFDRLGAFGFSPEEGTAAAAMPGQLPRDEIDRRVDAVMRAQQEISLEINQSLAGSELEVLVEETGVDENNNAYSAGRTYRDAPDIDGLFILHREEEPGEFITARVTSADEYDLEGE